MAKVVIGGVINRITKALPVGANRATGVNITDANVASYWQLRSLG